MFPAYSVKARVSNSKLDTRLNITLAPDNGNIFYIFQLKYRHYNKRCTAFYRWCCDHPRRITNGYAYSAVRCII